MIYVPVAPIKLTLIIYLFKCLAGLLSRKAFYKGSQKMEKAWGGRGEIKGERKREKARAKPKKEEKRFSNFPQTFPARN